MNKDIQQTLEQLVAALPNPADVRWTSDQHGNTYGWCRLPRATDLPRIARDLLEVEGGLVTITGHAPKTPSEKGFFEVSYHFVIQGLSLNLLVVPEGTEAAIPSITEWHKGGDWAERELAETYDIKVTGHPDMRPLFLNPETREGPEPACSPCP